MESRITRRSRSSKAICLSPNLKHKIGASKCRTQNSISTLLEHKGVSAPIRPLKLPFHVNIPYIIMVVQVRTYDFQTS